jgi:hypothetical protein
MCSIRCCANIYKIFPELKNKFEKKLTPSGKKYLYKFSSGSFQMQRFEFRFLWMRSRSVSHSNAFYISSSGARNLLGVNCRCTRLGRVFLASNLGFRAHWSLYGSAALNSFLTRSTRKLRRLHNALVRSRNHLWGQAARERARADFTLGRTRLAAEMWLKHTNGRNEYISILRAEIIPACALSFGNYVNGGIPTKRCLSMQQQTDLFARGRKYIHSTLDKQ